MRSHAPLAGPHRITFRWDIPTGATTPRGWIMLQAKGNCLGGLDPCRCNPQGELPAGFYLEYPELDSRKKVLAKVYLDLHSTGGWRYSATADCMCSTAAEATQWIEHRLKAMLADALDYQLVGAG